MKEMDKEEFKKLSDTLLELAKKDRTQVNSVMPENYEEIKEKIRQQQIDTARLLMLRTLDDISYINKISDGLKAHTDVFEIGKKFDFNSSNPFKQDF